MWFAESTVPPVLSYQPRAAKLVSSKFSVKKMVWALPVPGSPAKAMAARKERFTRTCGEIVLLMACRNAFLMVEAYCTLRFPGAGNVEPAQAVPDPPRLKGRLRSFRLLVTHRK